jgi:hypothetical protein
LAVVNAAASAMNSIRCATCLVNLGCQLRWQVSVDTGPEALQPGMLQSACGCGWCKKAVSR